jgi:holo-[acyl-carrier protein] synthase
MANSIGVDILETERIRNSVARFGDRFLRRILGDKEIDIYRRRADRHVFLAGRFACKEAVIKALGKYLKDRPPFSHIQIINDSTGQPHLCFPEALKARLAGLDILVSISHDRKYAVAMAVITEKGTYEPG